MMHNVRLVGGNSVKYTWSLAITLTEATNKQPQNQANDKVLLFSHCFCFLFSFAKLVKGLLGCL